MKFETQSEPQGQRVSVALHGRVLVRVVAIDKTEPESESELEPEYC